MPGLTVALNGEKLAAVSTEGRSLLDVRVHGDVISPEFAAVDMAGGVYDVEPSVYLTWIHEKVLEPGDMLEVTLVETVQDSHAGKTIEDLFPDEPLPSGPFKPTPQMFEELSKRPRLREGFRFSLEGPEGEILAKTKPEDHSFGFSVAWNSFRPDRARVSLHSNTLQGIENRSGGTDYATFMLRCGQRVKLRVDA